MINDDFICALTNEKIDFDCCGVMFDVVNHMLLKSCMPDCYTKNENFREICKNCESYKIMMELNQ